MSDTAWEKNWRDTSRIYYGTKLRVRWTGRQGDWTARLENEKKPTHHENRALAMAAAERRARALAP